MLLYLCPTQNIINEIVGKRGYEEQEENYIKIQEFGFQHQNIYNFSALHVRSY